MAVDNQTVYNYSLMALALMLWFVFYSLFAFIIELGPVQNIIATSETMNTLIPFVLGLGVAGGAFYGVKNHEVANRFGIEVIAELRKVVWPARKEVTGTTTGVLIFIFAVALFLFAFDKLFGFMIKLMIR